MGAGKLRYDSHVDVEAGREAHGLFLSDIFGKFLLKFDMKVERSVEETRTCTARTVFLRGLYGRFLYLGVVCKSHVAVGAEHEDSLSVKDDFGILRAFYLLEIRIQMQALKSLRLCIS